MHNRGYPTHADPETDSDGDGGTAPKLRGDGHIEFSKKGIPHGILHFPLQLLLAGHIYMHDTCAPEASHRFNIKITMNRVRKSTDVETSASLIDWGFRVRTWAKVIDTVQLNDTPVTRKQRVAPSVVTLQFIERTRLLTVSELRPGGDDLLCNDARLSYIELGTLISHYTGWDVHTVMDSVTVSLYCSALVLHPSGGYAYEDHISLLIYRRPYMPDHMSSTIYGLPSGETRQYWSTESRYAYNKGARRDMVEIDLGQGKIGCAEITSFIEMSTGMDETRRAVIIRWFSKSSLSTFSDDHDRPMCDFPLSCNHCLWQWSSTGRDRASFRVRGFRNRSVRQKLWSHVHQDDRQRVITSEIRARYDIIGCDSIKGHANIHEDPSTGHMLQTLQIV